MALAAVFVLLEHSRRVNAVCTTQYLWFIPVATSRNFIFLLHLITKSHWTGALVSHGGSLLKVIIFVSSWWHTAGEQAPPTYLPQHALGLPLAYPALLCTQKCSVSTHIWKPLHGRVSHPAHGLQVSLNNENSVQNSKHSEASKCLCAGETRFYQHPKAPGYNTKAYSWP